MGALYPVRKRWDYYRQKAGERITLPERRETQIASATRTTAGTTTLYTCPVNKKAKLTFWQVSTDNVTTSGSTEIKIGTTSITFIAHDAAIDVSEVHEKFNYEDAPEIKGGQVVSMVVTTFAGNVVVNIQVIEEDASGGYLLN